MFVEPPGRPSEDGTYRALGITGGVTLLANDRDGRALHRAGNARCTVRGRIPERPTRANTPVVSHRLAGAGEGRWPYSCCQAIRSTNRAWLSSFLAKVDTANTSALRRPRLILGSVREHLPRCS